MTSDKILKFLRLHPQEFGILLVRRLNFFIVFLVAAGILLRGWNLGSPVLFRDEAESAINALTILEHGVPTYRYLDLPVYENTLTQPWPDSVEYDFKDTSYSNRGLAIYHGWLPLYAMAASFVIFGISPDNPTDPPRVRHDDTDMRRRAMAARSPSVFFAGIFLVALFAVGQALYGMEAGMVALALGSFTPYLIQVSREARYYSATLAIGTLCVFSLCLLIREGRWRHFMITSFLLVLLFHTHILSFAVLIVAVGLVLPRLLKLPVGKWKIGVLGSVIAAGIFPWAAATGFFDTANVIPMAYPLLSFPQDLLLYPRRHPELAGVILGTLIQLGLVLLFGKKLPVTVVKPFRSGKTVMVFLIAMLCLSNLLFLFLMPAASFFLGRLTLILMVPGVLLASVLLTANARAVMPRNPGIVVALVVLAGLGLTWKSGIPRKSSGDDPFFRLVDYLRNQNFNAGTRLYALPYDHLRLTFYTGLPFQSIAPVRKEFLDNYKGDIVLVEPLPQLMSISRDVLKHHALEAGEDLRNDEIQKWQVELSTRPMLEHLATSVKAVDPPLNPLPAWAQRAFEGQGSKPAPTNDSADWADENPALFRGYHVTDSVRFWQVFAYRFVNPEQRSGAKLNYASRIRSAHARVLSSSWIIYHCDANTTRSTKSVAEKAGGS